MSLPREQFSLLLQAIKAIGTVGGGEATLAATGYTSYFQVSKTTTTDAATAVFASELTSIGADDPVMLILTNTGANTLRYHFGTATAASAPLATGASRVFPNMIRSLVDDLKIINASAGNNNTALAEVFA